MSERNLAFYRGRGHSIDGLRDVIRSNVIGKIPKNRFNNFYGLLEKRKGYAEFGESMGIFIREGDSSSALDLINNSNVVHRYGWVDFMDANFSENFFQCESCESVFDDEEAHNCYDDYSVCESCANDHYTYSNRAGFYVREDDESYSENDHIREYHTSSQDLCHIPSSFDKRKPRVLLGLELEMEVKDGHSRDEKAGQLLEKIGSYTSENGASYDYALCEEDRSLSYGFEMVTSYSGLDVHTKQLEFFKTGLRGMISHDSDNCGLHVHICKADMTTLHGAKMILFINDQANHKLIKAIARRDANDYAKIKNKAENKQWLKDAVGCSKNKRAQLSNLNRDRYEALNFKNDRTVEFRLFKGSLVYETIISCLEFTYATWFFTRESSTKNLTIDNFLKFICADENRADTKFLRAYLKSKGFELPEKSNVIQIQKSVLSNPTNPIFQKVA